MPESLFDKTTGKSLSPKSIRRNEADSSDDNSSDADSISSAESTDANTEEDDQDKQGFIPEDKDPKGNSALLGRDAEFELAKKRVLDRRMQLMRSGIRGIGE